MPFLPLSFSASRLLVSFPFVCVPVSVLGPAPAGLPPSSCSGCSGSTVRALLLGLSLSFGCLSRALSRSCGALVCCLRRIRLCLYGRYSATAVLSGSLPPSCFLFLSCFCASGCCVVCFFVVCCWAPCPGCLGGLVWGSRTRLGAMDWTALQRVSLALTSDALCFASLGVPNVSIWNTVLAGWWWGLLEVWWLLPFCLVLGSLLVSMPFFDVSLETIRLFYLLNRCPTFFGEVHFGIFLLDFR